MSMAINEPAPEKCPAKPSKRRWGSVPEAWEAADLRSEEVGIEIVPYRCDACGFLHLTKRVGGTSEIERRSGFEVFKPTNPATRRAALRAFIADHDSATTEEIAEVLGLERRSIAAYMAEVGWRNTLGRHARWIPENAPDEVTAPQRLHAVDKPVDKPVELAMRRHPSTQNAGWRPTVIPDKIRHVALGDFLDTLEAVGLEFRLMTREKES